MPSSEFRAILPEPPDDLKQLSSELATRIRARIRAAGPMPFANYMEMALYEPGLGYYSAGLEKFGADAPHIFSLLGSPMTARALLSTGWKAWRAKVAEPRQR